MRGIGQWASRPESWGPNWDLLREKKRQHCSQIFQKTRNDKFGLIIYSHICTHLFSILPEYPLTFAYVPPTRRTLANTNRHDGTHSFMFAAMSILGECTCSLVFRQTRLLNVYAALRYVHTYHYLLFSDSRMRILLPKNIVATTTSHPQIMLPSFLLLNNTKFYEVFSNIGSIISLWKSVWPFFLVTEAVCTQNYYS